MCRIVVYAGERAPVAPVMYGGEHSLHDQSFRPKELMDGSLNADGYAVAWYHEGRPVRVADDRPVWQNQDLEQMLGTVRSTMAVAGVRNASPGMPYGLAEVAPMILDRWTFTLNGYVREFRARFMRELRRDVPDPLYGEIQGTSDTETLFLMALGALERGLSLSAALAAVARTTIDTVNREGLDAQLNMALTDGESAAITRTGSLDRSNSLYLAEASSLLAPGTLVASEPLDKSTEWQEVAHHHVVELITDKDVTIRALSTF
ncbi:MAG: ergothioneine biosynthesis protein EgtC [Gemmatimonadota bacterium]|nr:MAG: ergothioneine biosynthesis protein EgtC [Gemmatimonadota bacterium]